MRVTEVAKKLSEELSMYITLSRISRYEERGILPSPPKVKGIKDYSLDDIERLKTIIILSELGIPLSRVRSYLLDRDKCAVEVDVKMRITHLKRMIDLWR